MSELLHVGLDVGSTTVKIIVMNFLKLKNIKMLKKFQLFYIH